MEDYKMVNAKQIDLTVSGKKELEEELEWRKVSERDRIKEAIKVAREQGDLSENADYTSAREEQSKNEARITEIEDMLKHARIVEVTTIKIRYVAKNLVKEFQICGSETDPFSGKISNESPLAKAVLGHKAFDHVFMTTETGKDIEIEILEIK